MAHDFVKALERSVYSVHRVATFLAVNGANVVIQPTVAAPSRAERQDYIDSGDMEIRMRVEVKERQLDFTCRADYPFDTIIIDECYKVDRIPRLNVWAWIIVNRHNSHAAFITSASRKHWRKMTKFDDVQGRECDFYCCPKHRAVFKELK